MAAKDSRACRPSASATRRSPAGLGDRDRLVAHGNTPFTIRSVISGMVSARNDGTHAALVSLEAAAASARSGFACMFSSSDEFETALISQRRAQGRYAPPRNRWPMLMFVGC